MLICNLNIITYNVRGLRNRTKRKEMFYYLHKKQHDIIFLQESHCVKDDESFWANEWGRKTWCSHGTNQARGVMILFNRQLQIEVHNIVTDSQGRFVLLYCTLDKHKWLLVNVYAPNDDNPDFFQTLFKKIDQFTPTFTVIGDDFNLGLNAKLDRQGGGTNNDKSSEVINSWIKSNKVMDAWRVIFPDRHGYTWRQLKPKPVFSRFDYFFVSTELHQYIGNIEIIPGFKTDHSIVQLQVHFCNEQRGNGYWQLNTSLLKDMEYIKAINKLIDIELAQDIKLPKKKKWELLKIAARGSTIQFATRRKKSNRLKIELLEKQLKKLYIEAESGGGLFTDTETNY